MNAVQHYLDRHLDAGRGHLPVVITRNSTLTYEQIGVRVERAAGALHECGVRRGDRVLLVLSDCPDAVAFIFGAMRIGAVPAPIHVGLSDDEYRSICEDCRPAAVVVSSTQHERISRLAAIESTKTSLFVSGTAGRLDENSCSIAVEAALAAAPRRSNTMCSPDAPALLQYTSGSTGAPKGVVHRQEALLALPRGFASYLELGEDDLCFSAAKLFFGYGLGNSLFFPFNAGAAVFLREESSDPVGVLQAINETHPTVFFGGPTLYAAILALVGSGSKLDLSSIRLSISAGEALGARTYERWTDRFGSAIIDGLGSTECLHIFAAARRPDWTLPGRLGPPVSGYEIRIMGQDGVPVRPGTSGIAEVRGSAVSSSYWNRPAETAETMVDGWVRTGDILREHDGGSLEFMGREDDVFKVRGMKVAPLEVEQQLLEHPAVDECAVVPFIDRWGIQSARAVIRLKQNCEPGAELARDIRAALLASVSRHKVPQTIDFVQALPRTNTGKLARRRIRDGQVSLIYRSGGHHREASSEAGNPTRRVKDQR